jgi:hypothetical protein
VGHLEDDKASQKLRNKNRVSKVISKRYAYAYSLHKMKQGIKQIGHTIHNKVKGTYTRGHRVQREYNEKGKYKKRCKRIKRFNEYMIKQIKNKVKDTHEREHRVQREYKEKGKCEKTCKKIKWYNKYTLRKERNERNKKGRKGKTVKYETYKYKCEGWPRMYSKYGEYRRGAEVVVNTSVHSVQKYGNQQCSHGLELRDVGTIHTSYVSTCIYMCRQIVKAEYLMVKSAACDWKIGGIVKMRRILSDTIRCSMNTGKAGGSAMDVDPVQFPDLAIGWRRGKHTANIHIRICIKMYCTMVVMRNRHYGE